MLANGSSAGEPQTKPTNLGLVCLGDVTVHATNTILCVVILKFDFTISDSRKPTWPKYSSACWEGWILHWL